MDNLVHIPEIYKEVHWLLPLSPSVSSEKFENRSVLMYKSCIRQKKKRNPPFFAAHNNKNEVFDKCL